MTYMGKPFIDLTNQTFNHWIVTGPHKSVPRASGKGAPRTHWFCTCSCGNTAWVDATNLRQGISTNCGCRRETRSAKQQAARSAAGKANTTHGKSYSPLYARYIAMMSRCYNPANKSYPWYGAKGITVCDRWREGGFVNFNTDMEPTYKPGLSLEKGLMFRKATRQRTANGFHDVNRTGTPIKRSGLKTETASGGSVLSMDLTMMPSTFKL